VESDKALIVNGMRIDPTVLRSAPVQRCAVVECQAACCTGGVWVDARLAARILESAAPIKAFLPPERHDEANWFSDGQPDENFPLGFERGTTTVDDPQRPGQTCCVFLRPDRKCALQVASNAHGLGWPGLKPFFCAIYPLYVDGDVLTMDDETPLDFPGGGCQQPALEPRPMYQIYREEAILILGEAGYRELCEKAGTLKDE
jgi:hypothetical protein